MKLDINIIETITLGAARIEEKDDGIHFYRLTNEQELYYQNGDNQHHYDQSFAPSGIKLSFKTNSENMYIKFSADSFPARKYFSVDVFKNNTPLGYIDNFDGVDLSGNYAEKEYPCGEYERGFSLGKGEKHILIHLPVSTVLSLKELVLDDNSYIKCVKPSKKLLAFGDSITQGYDSLHPSETYVTRLCSFLDMEEINKGIGGEVFCPTLATLPDAFTPDIITVAYGTNSFWGEKEGFCENCKSFFENLTKTYAGVKIFAITPIWRKDFEEKTPFGDFSNIEEEIINCTAHLKNVTVIKGFDLIPKNSKYFGDLCLHPTGEGFKYYAENLYKEIKKYL